MRTFTTIKTKTTNGMKKGTKTMKTTNYIFPRNVKIHAVNDGANDGFNIFVDFSGRREFLMHHRHNGLLYAILKDGIRLEALRRWRPDNYYSAQLERMVAYLLREIESHIKSRENRPAQKSAAKPRMYIPRGFKAAADYAEDYAAYAA